MFPIPLAIDPSMDPYLENIGCINNEMQKFLIGLSGLNTPSDLFRLNRNMDDWRLRTI